MTKGTTRRERKYRKKAVSVCKITSTSATSNAGNKSVGNNQEHGLLVTSALSQPATGTGSSSASQANNNNTNSANAFPSPQLSVNKVSSREFPPSIRSLAFPSSGNVGSHSDSHHPSGIPQHAFSSFAFEPTSQSRHYPSIR